MATSQVTFNESRDGKGSQSHTIPLGNWRGTADTRAACISQHLNPRVSSYVERPVLVVNVVKQKLEDTAMLVTEEDE